MKDENLKTVFLSLQQKLTLPEYLQTICNLIVNDEINIERVNQTLKYHDVNYAIAKVEFVKIIIIFIKSALEDSILTTREKDDILFLKRVLKIQPGDFLMHAGKEVEAIIYYQLSKIYGDNFINTDEALLKVHMQELFDLSFDKMNDYSKFEAASAIKQGVDPKGS